MPSITAIEPIDNDRYAIYVDEVYCCSVRTRTFSAMGLSIGSEVTCEEIVEREKNHWKYAYGPEHWEREGLRIERVRGMVGWADDRVETIIEGFGADLPEFIDGHPETPGFPDLAVYLSGGGPLVARIEVSGTERLRGSGYWIRPDKVDYALTHPDEHVWITLHYQEPNERVICIRPTADSPRREINPQIRDSTERYVVFHDTDIEVVGHEEFRNWLRRRVDQMVEP